MSAAAIRAFGVVTFIFEAAILFALLGPRAWLFGPPPRAVFISAAVLFTLATSLGIGLLFLRKWAATLFALILVGLPVWTIFVSFHEALPATYLILLAVVVVLPMAITIIVRSWRLLSWRGKWFI
jgi:hypothetical protein